MANIVTINVNKTAVLPDNDQWQNRFEIKSETSNRIYIIAQNKAKKFIGCSCPAWRTRRSCKHLKALNLPCFETPVELHLNSK